MQPNDCEADWFSCNPATPTTNPGAHFWVSGVTTTSFTINLAAAPGADTIFNFQVQD